MTDYDDYEDDDQQDETPLPRDLRRQIKALAKKNKELEDKLAEQVTRTRSMTLAEVLKAAGVNGKVASLVPSTVDPTEEAVGAWLKEYGDVFGATQGGQSPTGDTEDQEVPPEVQQMTQMQNVASAGEIKGQTRQVGMADLMAASSEKELWDLIRKSAPGS